MAFDNDGNWTDDEPQQNTATGPYRPSQQQWDEATNALNSYNDKDGGGSINWDKARAEYDKHAASGGGQSDWVNATYASRNSWLTPKAATTTSQPKTGGYNLEGIRQRLSFGKVDLSNPQAWLDANRDVAQGTTITKGKMYDASGRFMADVVSNLASGGTKSQFLDGIGSNGKPRATGAPKPPAQTTTQAWNATPGAAASSASSSSSSSQSIAPTRDPRLDDLYNELMARATQGLSVDRNNPVIRQQADAYAANEERAKRNYLADAAESAGPIANLRGEQRLATERMGQRTGAFEAELMGRELVAKRTEIAEALEARKDILTMEQTLALQMKMKTYDDAIARLRLQQDDRHFNANLGYQDRALAQSGQQFGQTLGFNYDNFDWERSPLNPRNMPQV